MQKKNLLKILLLLILILTSCNNDEEYTKLNPELTQYTKLAGYIRIDENDLEIDEVEIITPQDTERIEELGLDKDIDFPNGYHIQKKDVETKKFKLNDDTRYYFTDYYLLFIDEEEKNGDRKYSTKDKDEFLEHFYHNTTEEYPNQNIPFFIEVEGDEVKTITEEFKFTI